MSTGMKTRFEAVAGRPSKIALDHELNEIRLLLQEHMGVVIDRPTEILSASIDQFLAAHGFGSTAELISRMHKSPVDCEPLLEALLPGDSAFFCPARLFDMFRNDVLPEIAHRDKGEALRPLRIWSAGCSTGEEPYSIAMCVCEVLAGNCDSWNAHIVAGDIRRDALKVADRGLYPASSALHLPSHLVARYFSRVRDHLLVKPRLRNLVAFTHMNLTESAFIGRFHCIFCVAVLRQLSAAGKIAAWQRLQLALEPGGYIFLGEQDQLPAGISLLRHSACVYQRPFAAAAGAGK